MKKQNDYIRWTDIVFIPTALFVAYLLGRWLPHALAMALAVVLVSLIFSLFEPHRGTIKRFIFALLLGGTITYLLAALFSWQF